MKMKAGVVTALGQPLVFDDRDVPMPGDGQVLVKIAASGVCHTDLHAADGDWPVEPTLPFVGLATCSSFRIVQDFFCEPRWRSISTEYPTTGDMGYLREPRLGST